jgi:RNA polymerase sigma factor (sigma-70 family)
VENSNWSSKDWKWLFGILIGIIIILVTAILSKYNLGEYFSFASSMVSIILAIIAIIYAFMESNKSSESNRHSQNVLHEIDKKVLELGDLLTEIEKMKNELVAFKNDSKSNFDNILDILQNYQNVSSQIFKELKEDDTGNSYIDEIEKKFNKEFEIIKSSLSLAISTLSNEEEKVIRLRFGLDDGKALSLDEVAKKMNLSIEEVEKIEVKALRQLRKIKFNDLENSIMDKHLNNQQYLSKLQFESKL